MPESIVLAGVGIAKGNYDDKFAYYQIISKDESGQEFITTFGVRLYLTESTEKTFKRMFAVGLPSVTQAEEPQPLPEAKKELSEYEKLLLED